MIAKRGLRKKTQSFFRINSEFIETISVETECNYKMEPVWKLNLILKLFVKIPVQKSCIRVCLVDENQGSYQEDRWQILYQSFSYCYISRQWRQQALPYFPMPYIFKTRHKWNTSFQPAHQHGDWETTSHLPNPGNWGGGTAFHLGGKRTSKASPCMGPPLLELLTSFWLQS